MPYLFIYLSIYLYIFLFYLYIFPFIYIFFYLYIYFYICNIFTARVTKNTCYVTVDYEDILSDQSLCSNVITKIKIRSRNKTQMEKPYRFKIGLLFDSMQ